MGKTYGNNVCRVEFLSSGFRQLLYSPEVRDVVYRASKAMADSAGEGFGVNIKYGRAGGGTRGRVLAFVSAWTPEAREREAVDKVLTIAATKKVEV